MRKRIVVPIIVLAVIACVSIAIVKGRSAGTEDVRRDPEPGPTSTGIFTNIPDDSILFFMPSSASAQLIQDMAEGRTPTSCTVLYDEMGARPEVTVTDPEMICELYARLAHMTVGDKSPISITDAYHSIRFTLQDGTVVGWGFETEALLCMGAENYEAHDNGNLWGLVQELQDQQA